MLLTGASLLSLRGEYLLGKVLSDIPDEALRFVDKEGPTRWDALRRSLSDPNGSATVCPSTRLIRPRRVLGQIVEALKKKEYRKAAVGLWIHKDGTVIRTHDHSGEQDQFFLFCNCRFLDAAKPAFKAAGDQERAERRLLLAAVGVGSLSKDHNALLAEACSWPDSERKAKRVEAFIRDHLRAGNKAALLTVAADPECPEGLFEEILRIERDLRRQRGVNAVPSRPRIDRPISKFGLFSTLNWSRWGGSQLPGLAFFSKSSRIFAIEYFCGRSAEGPTFGAIPDSIDKELKRLGLKPALPGAPIICSVEVVEQGRLVGYTSTRQTLNLGFRPMVARGSGKTAVKLQT